MSDPLITFDTAGLTDLADQYGKAGKEATRLARLVVTKTGQDVQRDARIGCPVDTGNLRASIGIDRPTLLESVIGPTANYGRFVEYGTSRAAPQPYMRPALERNTAPFEQAIGQIPRMVLGD
ncbi:HK97-gp10 family putative phage morphogenesis protein [Luteimicrobium sp. NPDC057192]|uniref:HK97-gp10 family putative phage morphogenesis protein n=1 Tax=Luteimicrobium sp. NPDC057192 TaxID=3346042 RepID=UPI0036338A1E